MHSHAFPTTHFQLCVEIHRLVDLKKSDSEGRDLRVKLAGLAGTPDRPADVITDLQREDGSVVRNEVIED